MSQADWNDRSDPQQGSDPVLDIDIRALWSALLRRLWVIVACVVLAVGATAAYTFSETPLYTATTNVLIDTRENRVVDIEAVMSGLPGDTNAIDTEVRVIRSPALAERVVDKLNLIQDPEFNGTLRPPQFSLRGWIRSFFAEPPAPVPEEIRREQIREAVIQGVLGRLQVRRDALTYVIQISFVSESAAKSAKIANAFADAYLVDQLEAKFEATQRANDWLAQRLEDLREQVTAAERAVELFRSENDLLKTGSVTLNEQELSNLNAQLILQRTNLAEKEARLQQVRDLVRRGGNLETVAEAIDSTVISSLRQQQAQVIRRRADLESRYGPRHPEMIKVQRELRDLNTQITQEVQRIIASLENEVDIARQRVRSLEENLAELEVENTQDNQALVQLRQLQREAEASRTLYESFLTRFKETSQGGAFQQADARVIAEAKAPNVPSSPRKGLNLVLGTMLGGVVGLGFAFLLERLDNGFRSAPQVERALGLPVLSSVPLLQKGTMKVKGKVLSPQDYLLHKPFSSYSEAFRSLRTAIDLSDVDNPPRSVLFTSSMPSEGKTTSSISYARSLARAGVPTILIDGDLRHSSVSKRMGLTPEAGVVEVISGAVPLERALIRDEASGLYILPVAKRPANPQDLIGSKAFRGLMEKLSSQFGAIIVDSAPILPVSDTRLLATLVDRVVFAVRWEETPRDAVQAAAKELSNSHARIAGVILTQVDLRKQSRYGYGDVTYYYGQYGRYYTE